MVESKTGRAAGTGARPAGHRITVRVVLAIFLLGAAWQATSIRALAWQSEAAAPTAENPPQQTRPAYPEISLGAGLELKFLGQVTEEGKILTSKFDRVFRLKSGKPSPGPAGLTPQQAAKKAREAFNEEDETRQAVPPSIDVHRNAEPVEDFQPPERAVQVPKGRSVVGGFLDSVVSAVYGNRRLLVSPESVTTDSRHRVLITDGGAHAVHVLDRDSKRSFQIVGGPGRRLEEPIAVAVDGDDNIYVSDAKRALILVYDSSGQYLRNVGTYSDEPLFKRPSGIAIDRAAQRLYVADPENGSLTILDLHGHVQEFVEADPDQFLAAKGNAAPQGLQHPWSILLHNQELVVLDSGRILLLNLHGTLLRQFAVATSKDWRAGALPGLFLDPQNHIYVSDPANDVIREYSHEGTLLATIGRPGIGWGEFSGLAGMWADSDGRVYIADTRRVLIYQLVRR